MQFHFPYSTIFHITFCIHRQIVENFINYMYRDMLYKIGGGGGGSIYKMVTVVEHCTFYVDVHYLKFCILILGFLFKIVVFCLGCDVRYWNQIEANIDTQVYGWQKWQMIEKVYFLYKITGKVNLMKNKVVFFWSFFLYLFVVYIFIYFISYIIQS